MNYYIQGNAADADKIKAAFEELGYKTGSLGFTSSQLYYTIEGRVELMCTKSIQNLIKTHPDYKELELPKPHYDIANFYAGMPVLVRDGDSDDDEWTYALFSHYSSNRTAYKFSASGDVFRKCIPYEGNEHLLGTTDPCGEEYINW